MAGSAQVGGLQRTSISQQRRRRFVARDPTLAQHQTPVGHRQHRIDKLLDHNHRRLAGIGQRVRSLREHGFEEGVSTRLLVYAAQLTARGIDVRRACDVAIVRAITDDVDVQQAVSDIVDVVLP